MIADLIRDTKRDIRFPSYPFKIGKVGKDVEDFAKTNGIHLASKEIYFTRHALSHSQRATKGHKRVSERDLIEFPIKKRYMDKYYDGESFIYTDYKNKFIVHPNHKIKLPSGRKKVVNFVTAGVVTDKNEFKLKKYKKI